MKDINTVAKQTKTLEPSDLKERLDEIEREIIWHLQHDETQPYEAVRSAIVKLNREKIEIINRLPVEKIKLIKPEKIESFGTVPHYAVSYEDAGENYHFGWIPCALWHLFMKEEESL